MQCLTRIKTKLGGWLTGDGNGRRRGLGALTTLLALDWELRIAEKNDAMPEIGSYVRNSITHIT